ncbi:MAG: enoyl-CoA hydratase/isomerase family protein, partial [Thermoanaerobaculia bacterium]
MPDVEPRCFRVDRDGSRVTVWFDDGGMNLLSRAALEELSLLLNSLRTELLAGAGAVRVIAFQSPRPRLFAAGADMKEMSLFSGQEAERLSRLGQEVFRALAELSAVTVAWIDGDCFGGALDLAMAFDLRLATPRSRFSHPGARLGIVTGYGGTSRWR